MKTRIGFLVPVIFSVIVVLCVILYYFIMVVPTNEVFEYASRVMSGEEQPEENDPLYRYSLKAWSQDIESIECTVYRKWVWHEGKFGYMHVKYSQRCFDGAGNDVARSRSIDSVWIIEKINNKWVVVDVIERP